MPQETLIKTGGPQKKRRTTRSIRVTILLTLGLGMVCFIALFMALVRSILPFLISGGGIANLPAETVSALNWIIMLLSILVILFLYLLYWIMVSLVLGPIGTLTREVHRITSATRLRLDRYNHYGEIKSLSGSINDMVEKLSQSTMSTGVFRSIFNGLDAFLFVSDPENFEVFFINDSMKKAFSLDERAIGRKCWEIFEEGQSAPCAFCPVPRLKADPAGSVVWEAYNGKTRRYYKHTSGLIEWSDHTKAQLQHSIDITALKQTEQELIAAKEQAEESSAAKTDFLARMSHEMRTPLNAIIGMTAIARQNPADHEKIAYALPKINEASTHLLSLISDVLDMANIESGRLELVDREFDLEKMIRHVADMMAFRLDEKFHHFEVHIDEHVPAVIAADDQRLSQVLTNLLSNAIKFTPPHGRITLSVREVSGDYIYSGLRFELADTGAGIQPGQMELIFALFEQGEGKFNRRYGGTGLGLAICKSIVELMGGEIRAESEPGKGATFIFEVNVLRGAELLEALVEEDGADENAGPDAGTAAVPDTGLEAGPNTAADAGAASAGSTSAGTANAGTANAGTANDTGGMPDFTGKTLLLAEDIEINREIAVALLEDTGVAIDSAADGAEAFRLFAENPGKYDAILMDIHMPGMDGLEATRSIRALEAERAGAGAAVTPIPIIAMTANVFQEDIEMCLQAGMNGHLGKPIDLEKVLETLSHWLLAVPQP
ncbi:MAG: response regulator [Spirochaetaceae bacterium]|nr:response regulator [Spirochaetaceae bacterium]